MKLSQKFQELLAKTQDSNLRLNSRQTKLVIWKVCLQVDLLEFLPTEILKNTVREINQIRDLQTQYQNLVYIMKTVSGDFSDFNDWVQAHPGKTA